MLLFKVKPIVGEHLQNNELLIKRRLKPIRKLKTIAKKTSQFFLKFRASADQKEAAT